MGIKQYTQTLHMPLSASLALSAPLARAVHETMNRAAQYKTKDLGNELAPGLPATTKNKISAQNSFRLALFFVVLVVAAVLKVFFSTLVLGFGSAIQ